MAFIVMFKIQHGGIPTDMIYHIVCGKSIYIGQSKQGFSRIQNHINEAFRNNSVIDENYDGTGALKIYALMSKKGLKNTQIYFYSAENNYGLSEEDINFWLTLFIPSNANSKNWTPDKASQDQKRDVAEILHILHYFYSGYNLTNTSFGGQSTSWKLKMEDETVKLLTRQTSPSDAARLISASDDSIKNLFSVFNQVNEFLFTDKWKSIYDSKIGANITDPDGLLKLTWPEFVSKYVVKMIVTGIRVDHKKLTYQWDSKDTTLLKSFFSGKIDYLKAVTPLIGDTKVQPTSAQLRLLNKDSQHLFSIEISVENVMRYVTNTLQHSLENIIYRKPNKNTEIWTGNIKNKKEMSIISVTGLFDISKMHTVNNRVSEYIRNIVIDGREELSDSLKKAFALSQFQYIYNNIKKIDFPANAFYEYATEDLSIFRKSYDGQGYPVVVMTSKNISNNEKLNVRVHDRMRELKWAFIDNNWKEYFMEMMSLYRKYNNIPALYSFESSSGNTLYSTQEDLSGKPYIYFTDVYHQEMEIDLEGLTIY